jgi:hypothetical protein
MMMESIEHATVADEQEQFVWMRVHPLGDHGRNAFEYLVKGIGVWRKDVAGRLVRPQAVLSLDLVNYASTEATEVPFHEAAIDMDRLLKLLCYDSGCRERADERARNNAVDWRAKEALRCCPGLGDARCVKSNVRVPLIPPFKVPIRLAMSQKVEGAPWNHAR